MIVVWDDDHGTPTFTIREHIYRKPSKALVGSFSRCGAVIPYTLLNCALDCGKTAD